jgi:hypothetical protein
MRQPPPRAQVDNRGAKQKLEQEICGQFGWSSRYFQEEETKCWTVEVRMGPGPAHRFVSDDRSEPDKAGVKQGCNTAAALAIEGMQACIARQLAKPAASMGAAFAEHFDCCVRTAEGIDGWAELWAAGPRVVGIDVEGNLQTPPVLVQVATGSVVVLEAPSKSAGLSANLRRLLGDTSITKIFCDGTTGADKRCLGLPVEGGPGIIDLEDLASALAGPVGVKRGLARIIGLALPELPVRISKEKKKERSDPSVSDVMFFALIEQGRRPQLRGLHDVPEVARR